MKSVIITPSYAPDFERCKLLCSSVEKYVTSYDRHVIIVDACDRELFNSLAGPKTEIITKESILPRWLKKIPGSKKWWFSFRSLPVRGWILQQITKLSVAECIDADLYIFADSDIVVIRPVDTSSFVKEGKVRLYRVPRQEQDYNEPRHKAWYKFAGELFKLTGDDHLKSDYIGHLVTWRRETLLKLNEYIRDVSGKKTWQEHLCGTFDFSEYILYGIFSEFVLKDKSGHYWDESEICHASWSYVINNLDDFREFLQKLQPHHKAICVQSNLNMEPAVYLDYIKSLMEK